MPKRLAFTDDNLIEHPDAVWEIVALHVTTEGTRIVAYAYHNQEAFEAGRPIPGAVKDVYLSRDEHKATVGGETEEQVRALAWGILSEHPSTRVGDPPRAGRDDRPFFFKNAGAV